MMSVYKKIADEIYVEIMNGKYSESKKLPTEEELIAKYKVSRTTIRKSIGILVNKGYVYQVQGSGIFIRESAQKDYVSLENLKGLTRDFPNSKIDSEIIDIKVIAADKELSRKMECKVGTSIYFIKRLRCVNNEKFAIEYSYFNKDIIPYLSEEIAKKSIYSYIIDDLKLSIGFADKIIYADKLKENEHVLLGLENNDPALVIENTVFLSNGTIFEISKVVHNYKNTKLLKLANF